MKKRRALLIVLLILSSCTKEEKKEQERQYPVTITEAIVQDVPIIIESIGNVYADQTVQIKSLVTGIVEKTFVAEGAIVKKGDALFQIDSRMYQALLDQAKGMLVKDEATLNIAKIFVDTYKTLVEKDYVAKLNFEQYVSNVQQAQGLVMVDKANIDSAALNLEWTTIYAPFDGKISQFNIDVGNLVVANSSQVLTTLNTLTPSDIRFYINQKDFLRLQQAIRDNTLIFEVILPQDPLNPREGTIYFVDNTLNLSTGTILIKGYVDNKDDFLWPGEFINVRLRLKTDPNAILVPLDAVKVGINGAYVFVYNEDSSTVEQRLVKKGESIDQMVVIQEGIKPIEKVVVRGQLNLKDGLKVKVVEFIK
jgi:multidrug efflux system membrane fusion protein